MKKTVFIDGREGTTGLQIDERLAGRSDIELLTIDPEKRKDPAERKKYLNEADFVFLCLPDAAAKEAVSMIENPAVRVIDASTAHRTNPEWVYGFAELGPEQREAIANAKRVANPGCHATGFIACVAPLIASRALPRDYPLTCFSLTGYSGGGKKMIADYEAPDRDEKLSSPRIYGLNLSHKHLPEMKMACALEFDPIFVPVVDDYYKGMATTVMIPNVMLPVEATAQDLHAVLTEYYAGEHFVTVAPFGYDESMIAANTLAGTNHLKLIVCGREEQTIITALFDNLGKGASGAAVQNLNIMMGVPETIGLE